jgi:hypothetical protein
MPNCRDDNLRMGDRAEYLGQYFLSAFGTSVPVPRPEDIGIDYCCYLQQKTGRRLTFGLPFQIQIGTAKSKTFTYGGLTKAGEHKEWEIAFLRDQQLPFFVGTVDQEAHRFCVYSTSAMWFILHREERIGEIQLCPGEDARDLLGESRLKDVVESAAGRLPCFRVPLGVPVVEVTVNDFGTERFDRAAEALEYAVKMEHRNLVYRNIGVRHAYRLGEHEPNKAGAPYYYSFSPRPGDAGPSLEWLVPICVNLAMILHQQQRDGVLRAQLVPFLKLLQLSEEDRKILSEHAGLDAGALAQHHGSPESGEGGL